MNIDQDFLSSISSALYDADISSNISKRPTLVYNDAENGRKVLTSILSSMENSTEVAMGVAFATKSGVASIINRLIELEERKVPCRILVSQYQNFTQPEALRALKQFSNVDLRIAVEGIFHAKGYFFTRPDGYFDIFAGSSNLTASALTTNREWNLKITAAKRSELLRDVLDVFDLEYSRSVEVTDEFIEQYSIVYEKQIRMLEGDPAHRLPVVSDPGQAVAYEIPYHGPSYIPTGHSQSEEVRAEKWLLEKSNKLIHPNKMQIEALDNIKELRNEDKTKALLISATGTGKTYLSAFDVKDFGAKRILFIVHRRNIAEAALKSFRAVHGDAVSMGMLSGDTREFNADFIFSTILTIAKDDILAKFDPDHFDYIVIDESHRSGAESYKKVIKHFKPKFLLGMTATPERSDDFDIYKHFDHNIAYEIRLKQALEADLVCPFHYFGITDVSVDGVELDEKSSFSMLTSNERISHILHKVRQYGTDNGDINGLVFCRGTKEAAFLADEFNKHGFRSIALDGSASEEQRVEAINRLEGTERPKTLDFIFTVDIFNEGIDIPCINLAIMLRPTQSPIVFVQQLGRGLRKQTGKEYLTVLDFIGNYDCNFNIPIALYGDSTFNKDNLRRLMNSKSALIPGSSTINFDRIVESKILDSISKASFSKKAELRKDYQHLAMKLGRMPFMMDFVEHGSRDPALYADYAGSYFAWCRSQEEGMIDDYNNKHVSLMEQLTKALLRGKRRSESVIMEALLKDGQFDIGAVLEGYKEMISTSSSDSEVVQSALRCINGDFFRSSRPIVIESNGDYEFTPEFSQMLKDETFKKFVEDLVNYSKYTFESSYKAPLFRDGFILNQKYSRAEVCRILGYEFDEHSTMYGYKVKHSACPIFVNYHKEESISETTRYEDHFIDEHTFNWMTRSRRTLKSGEVDSIVNHKKNDLRVSLFVKQSNGEGSDFYYLGDVDVMPETVNETSIPDDKGKAVPIVNMCFRLRDSVEPTLYEYITRV
jgi:superfamily II DNA or RNA helicase/HKD family nuclease